MAKSSEQMQRAAEIRDNMLRELMNGIRTTEELRVVARDTRIVVYNHLAVLRKQGLIESSHSKRKGFMGKHRLTEKGREHTQALPPRPPTEVVG